MANFEFLLRGQNLLILRYHLYLIKYFLVLNLDEILHLHVNILNQKLFVGINVWLLFLKAKIIKKINLNIFKIFLITTSWHNKSNNSPPDAYSIINIISFLVSITSYKCIILGWRKNLLNSISLLILSTNSFVFKVDNFIIFAAIFWPVFSW